MAKDINYRAGHRTRLRERYLEGKLVDYEKLEMLLMTAIPRIDVKPIVKNLLRTFGGVREIITAPIEKLTSIPGIGLNTAIFIKAIHEINLIDFKNHMSNTPVFHDKKVLESYCKNLLWDKTIEEFHVFYLDIGYKMVKDELHSRGTSNWSAVYSMEIVKNAINMNAAAVVLLHNHPSGNSSFSDDDITTTREIQSMLNFMKIQLYDHFLVANGMVYSARDCYVLK